MTKPREKRLSYVVLAFAQFSLGARPDLVCQMRDRIWYVRFVASAPAGVGGSLRATTHAIRVNCQINIYESSCREMDQNASIEL